MNYGDDYRMATSHQQRLQADAGNSKSSGVITGALAGSGALAIIALAVLFLAGCTFSATPAVAVAAAPDIDQPGPSISERAANEDTGVAGDDEAGYLQQALAHTPAGARRFAFTHWARVHASNGFGGNSQATSRDQRAAYMLDVMNQSQAAAQLDSTHFLFQEQNWGWDSTDLLWEAEAEWQKTSDSVHVLQFRRDFDFAPLHALLAERGFAAGDYRGVTIYNVPLTEHADWHYRSHLAHHTFAFLADGLVVMAPTPAAVKGALDAGGPEGEALAAQADVAPLLPELAQMMAVEVQVGRETCAVYGQGDVSLSEYSLLVTGHRAGGDRQRDTLFLVYDAAGPAMADFGARREILQTGDSDQREANYGEVFDVQEASVDGRVLTYQITPTAELRERPGWPQTLVGWVQDADAVFAGCGAAGGAGLEGLR